MRPLIWLLGERNRLYSVMQELLLHLDFVVETHIRLDASMPKPELMMLNTAWTGLNLYQAICATLRSTPLTHDVPLVVLSTNPLLKPIALRWGADGFLTIPFASEDLLYLTQRLMRKPVEKAYQYAVASV